MIKFGTVLMTAVIMFGYNYYKYSDLFLTQRQLIILAFVLLGWILFGQRNKS